MVWTFIFLFLRIFMMVMKACSVVFVVFLLRLFYFFFFSSRRRHTRSLCEWSSDVCSSDLPVLTAPDPTRHQPGALEHLHVLGDRVERDREALRQLIDVDLAAREHGEDGAPRRVGDGAIDLVEPPGTGARHGLFNIQPIGRISRIPRASARPIPRPRTSMTPDDVSRHTVVSHDPGASIGSRPRTPISTTTSASPS